MTHNSTHFLILFMADLGGTDRPDNSALAFVVAKGGVQSLTSDNLDSVELSSQFTLAPLRTLSMNDPAGDSGK